MLYDVSNISVQLDYGILDFDGIEFFKSIYEKDKKVKGQVFDEKPWFQEPL